MKLTGPGFEIKCSPVKLIVGPVTAIRASIARVEMGRPVVDDKEMHKCCECEEAAN